MTSEGRRGGDAESVEAAMARLAAGDLSALGAVMEHYSKRLFGYIRRIVPNRETARDLLQDTFLKLYENRRRYKPGAPPDPWVFTIARNVCMSELRSFQNRRVQPADTLDEQFPLPEPGPAELAEQSEISRRLDGALAALPVEEREVFLLRIYDDMPFRSIAEVTGAPEATVRLRFNRGMGKLRGSAGL